MASDTDLMMVEVEEGAMPSAPPEPESESDYDLMPIFICPNCLAVRSPFVTSRCERCGLEWRIA